MDYRNSNPMSFSARENVGYDMGLRAYMLNIYNYMGSALALTGLTAYFAAYWAPLHNILYQMDGYRLAPTGLGILVMFAPLAFILVLNFGIRRLSLPSAQGLFWLYAATMGLSLSSIFFVYTHESIVRVFFISASLFGVMGLWGYSSKRDMTGMGQFLGMGVIGLLIAMVVNIFLQSSGLQFAISLIGVAVFTGLTAYDTQRLKALYYASGTGPDAGKISILGALQLYLDFINLFMFMLRMFGNRR